MKNIKRHQFHFNYENNNTEMRFKFQNNLSVIVTIWNNIDDLAKLINFNR